MVAKGVAHAPARKKRSIPMSTVTLTFKVKKSDIQLALAETITEFVRDLRYDAQSRKSVKVLVDGKDVI